MYSSCPIREKNTLLLLQDGAKGIEYLLEPLDTTRQALLPQMRVLEEHHLVSRNKDVYELTTIGKLIVEDMVPLLSTLEVLDIDIDYWGMHKLDFMPSQLLRRIDELKTCNLIKVPFQEYLRKIKSSLKELKSQGPYSLSLHTHFLILE